MNITEYFRSNNVDAESIELIVTIPTYKRPQQLKLTLQSLVNQTIDKKFAVIVMDNHEGTEGAQSAKSCMTSADLNGADLNGIVILAHDRGNCHAYNAGWKTALLEFKNFRYLAVIDDDEVADPRWLEELVNTAESVGADIVGGPQIQQFKAEAHNVWKRHPVFLPHYKQTGPVPILYSSGNVLISRHVLEHMPSPHLDPMFNFIGGGDSDFYSRCKREGFTFAWCNSAQVLEDVPSQRATFKWVNARSLRNGSISSIIDTKRSRNRLKTLAKSLVLLGISPFRSAISAIKNRSIVIGLYHVQVAIGRLLAEIGVINEQYRNPENK
ncbi:glycosyltransferase family 2 protein [Lentilitoribacter sp. EG35]|jgi:glycosyltransferase involved in cell wall biosynthesis|uniref:glycosyltransferase family 2 protein n=1 Tax=Lentilitoribacter sp. EG35 TaxID=3234192 RepID=UPI00345FF789